MFRLALIGTLLACSVTACAREATPPANPAAPAQEAPIPTPATGANESAATTAVNAQESAGPEPAETADASLERATQIAQADRLPGGRWQSGKHYTPIVPAQPTDAPAGKVEVNEIFWYGCGHCFALEPYISSWLKNKPDYIHFVKTPVMWGPVHKSHARLFYTLEALKRPELHAKVFEEIHTNGNPLVANDEANSKSLQLAWAKRNGIAEADFLREYDGFWVNTQLQKAEMATRRFRVQAVPLVIVGGKYSTDVAMAGGQSDLLQLINDLAASEKRR